MWYNNNNETIASKFIPYDKQKYIYIQTNDNILKWQVGL